jgi:hypothetical protein
MKRHAAFSLTGFLLTAAQPAAPRSAGPASTPDLAQALPKLCDFQMRRITSVAPRGGNKDYRDLRPGKTFVVAEIKGPGCIVHFRDNLASSESHHLQKHVLRMYWDGEATPSVEAPLGDFFGVGFGFTEKMISAMICIDDRRGKTNTDPAAFGPELLLPHAVRAFGPYHHTSCFVLQGNSSSVLRVAPSWD